MTIYLDLTRQFNEGRLRAVLSSGQAAVLLKLTIASKDGDWILREDQEALDHVLGVLERRGATYRFGAPLDLRWLMLGWSSHFQFFDGVLRVRTDFVTRPPRIAADDLATMWSDQRGKEVPFTGPELLLPLKQTGREKDWPIVGELARMLPGVRQRMLHSRSARDLLDLARANPELLAELTRLRPALREISAGLDPLRMALERERFQSMDADNARVAAYLAMAEPLGKVWPEIERATAGLPLRQAHAILVGYAERCLPMVLPKIGS